MKTFKNKYAVALNFFAFSVKIQAKHNASEQVFPLFKAIS